MSLWLTDFTFSFTVAPLRITNDQKNFIFILMNLKQNRTNKKSFAFRIFSISENNFSFA